MAKKKFNKDVNRVQYYQTLGSLFKKEGYQDNLNLFNFLQKFFKYIFFLNFIPLNFLLTFLKIFFFN